MNLTPEQKARVDIDAAFVAAGWILQNRDAINLAAGPTKASACSSLSSAMKSQISERSALARGWRTTNGTA